MSHNVTFKKQFKAMLHNYQLYLLVLLPLFYIIVFKYYPLWGAQIAFKDYKLGQTYSSSAYVGLNHFAKFIVSPVFGRLMTNTILLNLLGLLIGFPFPILMAICLHYCVLRRFGKTVQTIIYIPHFISTVIIVGLMATVLNIRTGVVNILIAKFGGEPVDFFGRPDYFRFLYILSDIWQNCGWNSIIYLSALSGVDPQLHEAAQIDGASIIKRISHIDIPCIAPTVIILLILSVGNFLKTGFEKVYLMQNSLNLNVSEVIDTFVYKMGLGSQGADFSYSTAIGLFQALIGFVLIMITNKLSKIISNNSMW